MKESEINTEMAAIWTEADRVVVSRDEILRQYGGLVRSMKRSLRQGLPRGVLQRALDLGQNVRFAFKEGMDLVSEALLPGTSMPPAHATRGASPRQTDTEPPSGPPSFAATLKGQGCIGRLRVTAEAAGKVKFTFALMDPEGHAISPFYLTVKDSNGTVLRDRHCFNDWQGSVSDVEMDTYTFVLADASGRRSVELGVQG
jgi:hypothetical protein